MSLSAWFPVSTPIEVGGQVLPVAQLRLRDLAMIEAFVAARLKGPLDGLDDADPSYADDLRAAYETVESGDWPPPPGSTDWSLALLGDRLGLAFFLRIILRDAPGADVDAIAGALTPAEFQAIEAAAWGVAPDHRSAVVRAIDRTLGLPEFAPAGGRAEGKRLTMAGCVALLVCGSEKSEPLPWATPAAVGDLTLSQMRLILAGGEPRDEEDPLPDDADLTDRVNAARREFFGAGGRPRPVPVVEPIDAERDGPR